MEEEVIDEVQVKNGMDGMEGDKASNSSSRKHNATQNEGRAKWGRTAASQKKNQTRTRKQLVATRPQVRHESVPCFFVYNCV